MGTGNAFWPASAACQAPAYHACHACHWSALPQASGNGAAEAGAARAYGRSVVVEQFAEGRDHRVLVIDGKVAACAERVPARVAGDGRRSIRALVEEANRDPRRGIGQTSMSRVIGSRTSGGGGSPSGW